MKSTYQGEYGFDYYYIPSMKDDYEILSTIEGKEYFIPWMTLETNTIQNVTANLYVNKKNAAFQNYFFKFE